MHKAKGRHSTSFYLYSSLGSDESARKLAFEMMMRDVFVSYALNNKCVKLLPGIEGLAFYTGWEIS